MIIKSLYIENYKKFHKKEIVFADDSICDLGKDIFDKMHVTLFVGENGSGKTTILSFIALIFRYLQRHRERIPCDFILNYQIGDQNASDIEISKCKEDLYIKINDEISYIMEFDLRKKKYIKSQNHFKSLSYDDITDYLPTNVIVMGFDADYEIDYASNYYGDRLVQSLELSDVYKTSGFGLDISPGILEFLYAYYNNPKIADIFNNLGLEFAQNVDVFFNYKLGYKKEPYDFEYGEKFYEKKKKIILDMYGDKFLADDYWKPFVLSEGELNTKFNIRKYLSAEPVNYALLKTLIEERMIYINEFYIKKDGKEIALKGMSTGEKIYLCRIFFLLTRIEEDSLVIIEEPETHLNILWIRQLIPLLTLLFNQLDVHLLISSHNYSLINMLFQSQIILLKDSKISNPDFNTFLANESEINNKLFLKSVNVTMFEEKVIDVIKYGNREKKADMLENLGESFLKFMLYKKIED